jgi:hypothetical protein
MIAVTACTERIDIKTDDAPPQLVIYGYITSDTMQHSIRITRSAGYFTTNSPEGVSHATVTISDNEGKIIPLAENDTIPGLYQTAEDVYGVEGKTYKLEVQLNSDGDNIPKHYQSSESYMRPIHHIDSIKLKVSAFEFMQKTVDVRIFAKNTPAIENYFFTIFVAINDSVVNPNINRFFVIDNAMFRGMPYIYDIPCYFLSQDPDREHRNEILHIGDKVTLNMNAISKEYATFISNVQSEIRPTIPIFSGPPANVPTNIRCIEPKEGIHVSGFFTAFPSRYAHTWVKEEFTFKQ